MTDDRAEMQANREAGLKARHETRVERAIRRDDEFDWRQVKDPRGVYVHSHPTHAYPGLNAWNSASCSSGEHPGCEVGE